MSDAGSIDAKIFADTEVLKYDEWNSCKKELHVTEVDMSFFPKEGEVWMAALGQNIGIEQNGGGHTFSRPVLIVKKFNNKMFWCVPLSTKQKSVDFYYNFTDPSHLKVAAVLAQMKLMSVKRLQRKMYDMPAPLFGEIRKALRNFL